MVIYIAPNSTLLSVERNFLLTQQFNLQLYNDGGGEEGGGGDPAGSSTGPGRLSAIRILNTTLRIISKG